MLLKILVTLCLIFCSSSIQLEGKSKDHYKYNLALCGIFQDEAPYLAEWIEFHRLVGVEHFYLFNNYSTDNYKEVLAPYIKRGIVELHDWPYPNGTIREWRSTQIASYNRGIKLAKHKAKWLIFIDTDEFLFPTTGSSILNELKSFEKYGGVSVNWLMFGSSGINKIPSSMLQTEALTWRAEDLYGFNYNTKSIVRPERVKECRNAHCFYYLKPYTSVNMAREHFDNKVSPSVAIDSLRINHYWTRDEDYFYNQKVPRHERWGENFGSSYKILMNLHVVEDLTIQRFIPQLRENLNGRK